MDGTKSLSSLSHSKTDVESARDAIRTNWSDEELERRRIVAVLKQSWLTEKLLAQEAHEFSRAA